MNEVLKYISCFLLVFTLAACSKNNLDEKVNEGEGTLSLNYSFTKADNVPSDPAAEILKNSTLKIYKKMGGSFGNGGLIFKYSPATDMPEDLALIAGDYKITLEAGTGSYATFDNADRSYYGEKEFTVLGSQVNTVDLLCKTMNSVVEVVFDQTILDKFDVSKECFVSAINIFDKAKAEASVVPTLKFTESGTGYFLLPEGVFNLGWGFYGKSSKEDLTVVGGALDIEATGAINGAQPATKYSLTFKYTKTPDGSATITIKVDESAEELDDAFSFAPQPTIKGDGFNIANEFSYIAGNVVLNISALNPLEEIEIMTKIDDVNNSSFVPFENKSINNINNDGIVYTPNLSDPKLGTITLHPAFFEKYASGGLKDIIIRAYDETRAKGQVAMKTKVSGVLPIVENVNLWLNKATFKACVTSPASQVVILYREMGDPTWIEMPATLGPDGYYSATVEPTWTASKNQGGNGSLDVYTINSGILANNKYEYKLSVNNVAYSSYLTYTTAAGDTIPYGDMESSDISCWSKSNGSSTNWASGNNSFTSGLCRQGTADGTKVAVLQSSETAGMLAAGNLFFGQFNMAGLTSGAASFGQQFNWTTRPKSFKFKYSANLGIVDVVKNSSIGVSKGDKDQARVYIAIVDWSARHKVTAGTNGKPSGTWDPEKQNSVSEGKVIAYASLYISQSTSGDMVQVDIPFHYYDKIAKPSKTYSIMISACSSNLGDYMVGSSSSQIKVDDFQLAY